MAAPTCTAADVAAIIPERALSAGGSFTNDTTPTLGEVQSLITQVAQEVIAAVGPDIDSSLASFAQLTVATGVAAQVELAFTDDLAKDVESKYTQLQRQYWGSGPDSRTGIGGRLQLLADAQNKLNQGGESGIAGPESAQAIMPNSAAAGFPQTTWSSRF